MSSEVMEVLHCDACYSRLAVGQIGLCDACQADNTPEDDEEDTTP